MTTAILVSVLPATATKPTRFKASSPFEGGHSRTIIISKEKCWKIFQEHSARGINPTNVDLRREAALALSEKFGWEYQADDLIAGALGGDIVFVNRA